MRKYNPYILAQINSTPEILQPLLSSSHHLPWLEQHFHPIVKKFNIIL